MSDGTVSDTYLERAEESLAGAVSERAEESLAGAVSERANDRPHTSANRAYYACFQAAISAPLRAGIRPSSRNNQWSHETVQAQFVGQLINRRKPYPSSVRGTPIQALRLSLTAITAPTK